MGTHSPLHSNKGKRQYRAIREEGKMGRQMETLRGGQGRGANPFANNEFTKEDFHHFHGSLVLGTDPPGDNIPGAPAIAGCAMNCPHTSPVGISQEGWHQVYGNSRPCRGRLSSSGMLAAAMGFGSGGGHVEFPQKGQRSMSRALKGLGDSQE